MYHIVIINKFIAMVEQKIDPGRNQTYINVHYIHQHLLLYTIRMNLNNPGGTIARNTADPTAPVR